jgi:hypothetical protein
LRFSGVILENMFMCFGGPHAEKRSKTRLKQNRREKMTGKKFFSLNFFDQRFLTWTFPKTMYGVFELPLLRNAQKRHKQKSQKIIINKGRYLPTPFSGYLPDIRRFQKQLTQRQGALKKKVTDPCVYLLNFRGTNQPQNIIFLDFFFSTFLGVSR